MTTKISRIRIILNEILNGGAHTKNSRIFRNSIAIVIIIDIFGIFFNNYPNASWIKSVSLYISYLSALIFFMEYTLRIFTAKIYFNKKRKYASLRYIFSFFGIIDLIAILPFILPYLHESYSEQIQIIDFTRLFLIFKLSRYSHSLDMIKNAFRSIRTELLTGLSAAMIIVTVAAITMYYIEKDAQPEVFDNIGQGFWWAIITFTTVGYGDIYPITMFGKILASMIALVGIGMIALPTGIISSAFMSQINIRKNMEQSISNRHYNSHHKAQKHTDEELQNYHKQHKYCPHCGKKLHE